MNIMTAPKANGMGTYLNPGQRHYTCRIEMRRIQSRIMKEATGKRLSHTIYAVICWKTQPYIVC